MSGYITGLENLHIAKMNDDGTYAAPVKIAGSVEASVTPSFNFSKQYGDNKMVDMTKDLSEVELSFTVNDLDPEAYELISGETKNTDGVIEDSGTTSNTYFALGYEATKSNGAKRKYWLYKGMLTIPEESYTSKTDSTEYQNVTITGRFIDNGSGKWRARIDSDDSSADPMITDEWFLAVYPNTVTV